MKLTKYLKTIFALSIFGSSLAYADSLNNFGLIEPSPMNEVWVNAGMQSYHFAKDQNFNNNNLGIGVEYAFNTVAYLWR